MASSHRRKLLKECASRERELASDVIARIALDEIQELDNKLDRVTNELKMYGPRELKVKGTVK